jgi:hypothetical protein
MRNSTRRQAALLAGAPAGSYIYAMTEPKKPTEDRKPAPPRKKGGVVYHGIVPDDDPIYKGGWNFLSGKNLKPVKPDEPDPLVGDR